MILLNTENVNSDVGLETQEYETESTVFLSP